MAKLEKKVLNGIAPVTLAECVYVGNGTANTLKDVIIGGTNYKIEEIKNMSANLKNYRGIFNYDNYKTNKDSSVYGDFWLWDGDSLMDFDFSIAYPGDAIYKSKDGIFKVVHIPKTNNIVPKRKYDVCIVGGGAGGIGSAYALQNSGYKVCIVERLDTLGGTHCNGVGLLIASPICDWYKSIAKEAYDLGKLEFINNSTTGKVGRKVGAGTDFEKMFRAALFEDSKNVINGFNGNHININDIWFSQKYYNDFKENIDIFINNEVIETKSSNKKLDYIKIRNVLNGTVNTITADYFIDCSGDGVLFTTNKDLALDTDYYIGTDPRDRFNESAYPENYQGDKYGINSVEPCYYQTFAKYIPGYVSLADYPNPTNYRKYEGVTAKANYLHQSPGGNGCTTKTVSNSNGSKMSLQKFIDYDYDWNLADGESRALATFMVGGYTAGNRFNETRKLLAIREKYRVACEKTVDQTYLTKQITSQNYVTEKTIALSTWWVDIHNQSYFCTSNIANGVPYESMIPKCYTNTLVACRAYGASHIALSSVRLVKTMMDLGHSAGTAIKQLLDNNTRGDVRTVDVPAVQNEIGIGNVIQELETHFYKPTVEYTEDTP